MRAILEFNVLTEVAGSAAAWLLSLGLGLLGAPFAEGPWAGLLLPKALTLGLLETASTDGSGPGLLLAEALALGLAGGLLRASTPLRGLLLVLKGEPIRLEGLEAACNSCKGVGTDFTACTSASQDVIHSMHMGNQNITQLAIPATGLSRTLQHAHQQPEYHIAFNCLKLSD